MRLSHGIGDMVLGKIISTVSQFPQVERLLLYGSRARGQYKVGSDIDLAIDAPSMSQAAFSRLWNQLDDLPIVYTMDVVHIQDVSNRVLLDEINREGITLWQKN